MFAERATALRTGASQAMLLLANPPFEHGKALRVLRETIQCLPAGAVFGVVTPQAILYSPNRSTREFRHWLVRNCRITEICAFPEGIFQFSKHESALLLGQRVHRRLAPLTTTCFRKVRRKIRRTSGIRTTLPPITRCDKSGSSMRNKTTSGFQTWTKFGSGVRQWIALERSRRSARD